MLGIRGGSSSVTLNPNYSVPALSLGSYRKFPYETIPRLVGPLSKEVLSCVPHASTLRGKYNSLECPSISLRGHIAFNSYWENLLAAFPAFTLSSLCIIIPHFERFVNTYLSYYLLYFEPLQHT